MATAAASQSGAENGSKITATLGHAQRATNAENKLVGIMNEAKDLADSDFETEDEEVHKMGQMGAKRIGSLAIGIGVVGIVLNTMADMDIVQNSTGVISVVEIFETAGAGLQLLVVGVIIAAAAVLLNLWSGF